MVNVGVITTSYQYGSVIRECLESVREQAQGNPDVHLRHVVIDAGSTDGTREVLDEWKRKSEDRTDFAWYLWQGCSQTVTLNGLMKMMQVSVPKIQYLGWLNADDVYMDSWLAESLHLIQRFNCDMVCSDIINYGGLKGTQSRHRYWEYAREIKLDLLRGGNTCIAQPTILLRMQAFRMLWERTGFWFNPEYEYCQDYDLWWRLLSWGFSIQYAPVATVLYRIHSGQMSRRQHDPKIHERDQIRTEICRFLEEVR